MRQDNKTNLTDWKDQLFSQNELRFSTHLMRHYTIFLWIHNLRVFFTLSAAIYIRTHFTKSSKHKIRAEFLVISSAIITYTYIMWRDVGKRGGLKYSREHLNSCMCIKFHIANESETIAEWNTSFWLMMMVVVVVTACGWLHFVSVGL